jgi:glycosyltransferase involved in cell wall biosynthesis
MVLSKEINYKILPVAIMAHNEEKVIQNAMESVLEQKTPVGYSVKAVVVANGCNDRTEEIVKEFEKKYPNKVILVSIKEKGKTKAINKAIKYFDQILTTDLYIPYVIFLDADCEFNGNDTLINFVNRFEQNFQLCAVGADCIPDVFFNSRTDIVAEIYKATYSLGQSLRINSISGMCYGIRLEVLKKIEFPEFQFAEDMFVSARLDGWFLKDRNIQIVFKTPSNLGREISRRTRQEISTQRYHKYYSTLRSERGKVKLFEGSLGEDFRWWGALNNQILKKWLQLNGVKTKLLVGVYEFVLLVAKIKAWQALRTLGRHSTTDYWTPTSR